MRDCVAAPQYQFNKKQQHTNTLCLNTSTHKNERSEKKAHADIGVLLFA
jgi:hypothetical protein